ncbi:helix-turn-helix domain-containing protein [Brevundimonas sp. TWP2-3-4b1]|uniref:helix-turn-helix domain-containing protein n=1 Tax=Brevundimonas sp. TWP2-3-4b1 TaxID=2804580 RepID=UPI003CF6F81C
MSDVAVTWAKAQTCISVLKGRRGPDGVVGSDKTRADSNAKAVLVAMASYADAEGRAWVLVDVLAMEIDKDRRMVERGRQALVAAGLLLPTGDTHLYMGRRVPIYRMPLELGHASTVRRRIAEREAAALASAPPVTGDGSRPSRPPSPVTGDPRHGRRAPPVTGDGQIGKGISQDQTQGARASEPDSRAGVSAPFEAALAAWSAKAPERASRPLAWDAWIAAIERAGLSEADLSRAVLAAVARDADFGRGKAMNFHRWLTEGRFEPWLVVQGRRQPSGLASAWDGPAEVREAVVQALGGEAAAVSYLDPALWDGGRRIVLAAGRTAADRLRRDAGRALKALGVGVEVRNSDNSSERVRA